MDAGGLQGGKNRKKEETRYRLCKNRNSRQKNVKEKKREEEDRGNE